MNENKRDKNKSSSGILISESEHCSETIESAKQATAAEGESYQPKMKAIVTFMLAMALVEFAQKDLTGSQFQSLLAAKFGWQDQKTSDTKFTVITSLGLCGTLIGNAMAGRFMHYGRRLSIFIGCFTAIMGACLMQILVYSVFTGGTVMVQFGTGVMEVAQSRLIEEYVPLNLLGPCLAVISVVGQLSTLIGLISVNWMPNDTDTQALEEDESWRYVQGLQLLVLILIVLYMVTMVKYDSPKFYVTQKQDQKAKQVIKQIYFTDGIECTESQILSEIKHLSSVETNEVSLVDAFWKDEKYRRSSWIAISLTASVWLCGFQVILNYANNIITQISKEDSWLDPRQSTYALGFSQFIGSVISLWAVTKFGRRTLLLVGHIGCSILLVLLSLCVVYDLAFGKILTICAYSFLFNVTNATVVNVYLVEICTDIAFGAALVVMQLTILIETLTALKMMAVLSPQGFFLFYAFTSFLGFIFVYFCIGETKHLTEKEKKLIYQPGGEYGRKLKGSELWEGKSIVSSELSDRRAQESSPLPMGNISDQELDLSDRDLNDS